MLKKCKIFCIIGISDYLFAARLGETVEKVLEREIVEIIENNILKSFPNVESYAFVRARTLIFLVLEAGNGSEVAFREAENLSYNAIFRLYGELVTALKSACSIEYTRFVERGDDLLKIFFGYLLAFCYVFEGYIAALVVYGEVKKHTQSVAAFCRNFHCNQNSFNRYLLRCIYNII